MAAAAMASMAPVLVQTAITAAGPGAVSRSTKLYGSSSSTSSLVCRASSKEENVAEKASEAVGSALAAVEEAAADAVNAAAGSAVAAGPAVPGVEIAGDLSGTAEWYKLYGRSVADGEDARNVYYGPNRPLWKGPFTQPKDVPEWLKGEVPGDYGCDIFGLVRQPKNLERLRQQELMNARWAMLGIAGCLAPELISGSAASPGYQPVWFLTGAQLFSEQGIDYLGVPGFINAHSIVAVVATQAVLMGLSEYARTRYVPEGVDAYYPGGKTFDPLGFGSDPEILAELKVKEIKNGRLAMMAMAGLFAQGFVTGVSPLQNFADWVKL